MDRNILFIIVVAVMFFSIGTAFASENTTDIADEISDNNTKSNMLVSSGSAEDALLQLQACGFNIPSSHSLSSTADENNIVGSNSSDDDAILKNLTEENLFKNNSKSTNYLNDTYDKIYVTDGLVEININSSNDFKNVIKNITNFAAGSKNIILNLTSTTYYLEDSDKDIVFNFNTGNLLIKGNNALITTTEGNIIFRVGTGANLYITNCRFTKAKPPIRNYGTCYVVNCTFDNNQRANTVNAHNLYRKGGAIDNYGSLTCIDCNFTNNLASYGGAVCCEENSENVFINCLWKLNTAGDSNCGHDIYIHNSAFVQLFYNSTSQTLPSYAMQQSGVIQLIDITDNSSTNNKVYDANNLGDILNVFNYVSTGVYNATNITLNLKNMVYTFNQDLLLIEGLSFLGSFIYTGFLESPWESLKSLWGMGESLYEESVSGDIKDSDNDNYLCWVRSGLTLTINGNGATFKCDDSNYRLFYIVSSANVVLNNLTITGFTTSILNNGVLICNGVTFSENEISYVYDDNDIGGAVRNYGVANFINTNFLNNYANKGGAIYNELGSVIIDNCTFKDNYARFSYKMAADEKKVAESTSTFETILQSAWNFLFTKFKSIATVVTWAFTPDTDNDIYSVGGVIKINTGSKNPVCSISGKNNYNVIYMNDSNMSNSRYFDSLSDINKLLKYSSGNGAYNLILRDSNEIDKTIASTQLNAIINNFPEYSTISWMNKTVNGLNAILNTHGVHIFNEEDMVTVKQGTTLILDGSNEIIKSYAGDSGETHFITNYGMVILKNMTLDGFNKAIINYGQLFCENVTFKNCRVNYLTGEDYGGAVYNIGNAVFINCTFIGNYAKYGAAVYNLGSAEYINCTGINNIGYKSNAGFYDDEEGCSKFVNCTLNNSSYFLNDGSSMTANSVLTYLKNALVVAVFIAGVSLGYFYGGSIAVAAGSISSYGAASWLVPLIGGLGLTADTVITSYLNTANHVYVSPGEYIVTTVGNAIKYMGAAAAGYSLGAAAKTIYDKFKPQQQQNPIEPENVEVLSRSESMSSGPDLPVISENASFNIENISKDYG